MLPAPDTDSTEATSLRHRNTPVSTVRGRVLPASRKKYHITKNMGATSTRATHAWDKPRSSFRTATARSRPAVQARVGTHRKMDHRSLGHIQYTRQGKPPAQKDTRKRVQANTRRVEGMGKRAEGRYAKTLQRPPGGVPHARAGPSQGPQRSLTSQTTHTTSPTTRPSTSRQYSRKTGGRTRPEWHGMPLGTKTPYYQGGSTSKHHDSYMPPRGNTSSPTNKDDG